MLKRNIVKYFDMFVLANLLLEEKEVKLPEKKAVCHHRRWNYILMCFRHKTIFAHLQIRILLGDLSFLEKWRMFFLRWHLIDLFSAISNLNVLGRFTLTDHPICYCF